MPTEDNKTSSSSSTAPSSIIIDPNSIVTPKPSTELDEATLFRRLSLSSRQALNRADGIQRALGQDRVHMEHLIAGLLGKQGGPTETLLKKANIDATTLGSVVETTLPTEGSYTPSSLTTLPPISDHVRNALIAARDIADSQKSEPVRTRHILYGALSIINCHVIQALLTRGIRKEEIDFIELPSTASPRLVIPGFYSDDPDGKDLLGITREVEALCAVLAAKDVELPLSLGLFGDWGSGKSFFMRMMEKRIDELKKKVTKHPEAKTAYCTNIVQLKFNAWHYIDTDLWASLVFEIFEGLNQALARKDDTDPEYTRAHLLADTVRSKDELAQAKREKADADAKLEESEEKLRKLKQDEATIENSLTPRALLQGTLQVIIQQPEVRETIESTEKEIDAKVKKAAKELNYPTPDEMEIEMKTQLLELHGIWGTVQALIIALRNPKNHQAWLLLILGVVLMVLALVVSVLFRTYLIAVLASIGSLLVGVAVALAPFVPGVRQAINIIKQVQEESASSINKVRQRRQAELLQELDKARQRVEKAQLDVEKASTDIMKYEQAMENLRTDRQMSDFIKQRRASTDYTKHFGVIANAREDFEKLTILLAKEREEAEKEKGATTDPEKPLLPRIDRIILYIDDLDRCPEIKVVDVLQAIHLLLAFPLFIVVVGVDPRWLLHSLKQHTKAFQNERGEISEEERTHWQSTPLNYLEKIFQIPYTLRPMQETGFSQLVDDLSKPQHKAVARKTQDIQETEINKEQTPGNGVVDNNEKLDHQAEDKPSATPVNPPEPSGQSSELSQSPSTAVPTASTHDPSRTDIDLNPGYLQIEEWERTFMKQLYQFIPTPRSAKRFVNVYRLLRASVDDQKLPAFIGDEKWGEHRAVLLLLAILTGYPTQATEIFRVLLEKKHPETWWQFIDSFKMQSDSPSDSPNGTIKAQAISSSDSPNGTIPNHVNEAEAEQWQQLIEKLARARSLELVREDQQCTVFIKYAPQVARYSFQSGRVLISQKLFYEWMSGPPQRAYEARR